MFLYVDFRCVICQIFHCGYKYIIFTMTIFIYILFCNHSNYIRYQDLTATSRKV